MNSTPLQAHRTMLAAILASVGMLFTAFAAAYIERQTAAGLWQRIDFPGLVWANTFVLLLSSLTVEVARRTRRRNWLAATMALGLLFVVGQVLVWAELRGAGVFLPSTAHGSFFYLLTALHGLHVLGGLIALGAALAGHANWNLCAGYWHFMGVVWLYVLVILTIL